MNAVLSKCLGQSGFIGDHSLRDSCLIDVEHGFSGAMCEFLKVLVFEKNDNQHVFLIDLAQNGKGAL